MTVDTERDKNIALVCFLIQRYRLCACVRRHAIFRLIHQPLTARKQVTERVFTHIVTLQHVIKWLFNFMKAYKISFV